MEKRNLIVIMIVAVAIVAGAASAVVFIGGSNDETDMSSNTDNILLTIYGNANGDNVIDEKDKEIIEKIISDGIDDWVVDYPYADADQDGKITEADAEVVQKYINKEDVRIYYKNNYDMIYHVQCPLGCKIGVESPFAMGIVSAVGLYDDISTVTQTISNRFAHLYPDLASLPVMGGDIYSLTLEGIAATDLDVIILVNEPDYVDYQKDLWKAAEASGLSDTVDFINVPHMDSDAVGGALILGALANT